MSERKAEKITAIIPTFNEEARIEKALKSVSWADEILVVDSFSTDRTLEIAKEYGARIIQREYGYSASQKNWAIPQATHPWIFLLDADEWVMPEMEAEIRKCMGNPEGNVAFLLPRINYYMDKRVRFCGWQGDSVVRLFMRDHCRYEDKRVHAEIIAEGKSGQLKWPIHHNTYTNFSDVLRKIDRYSTWKAKDKVEKGKKSGFLHMLFKPAFTFIKNYFFRLGILDGRVGFIICSVTAWSVFLRQVKIWRIHAGEKLNEH